MCGIFGYVNNNSNSSNDYREIIKNLFILSESRGKEAAGFATIDNNEIIVHKSPFPASKLIKSEIFETVFNKKQSRNSVVFIGHSRLVTDGYEHDNKNNQPYIKHGIVGIHNGIIVNKNELWKKFGEEKKETELDSELIPEILNSVAKQNLNFSAVKALFGEIYGTANIAFLHNNYNNLWLATNNGSLYYAVSKKADAFIFASEEFILKSLIVKQKLEEQFEIEKITQLGANSSLSINLRTISLEKNIFAQNDFRFSNVESCKPLIIKELNPEFKNIHINTSLEHKSFIIPKKFITEIEKRQEKIAALKRCTNCVLPETFPFIEFDNQGVCNYCKGYKKISLQGQQTFNDLVIKHKNHNNKADCLIPFSGGRDSSFCLHYVVKELGMKPIAFSYDWGMLTDLARRNQARMCGKLGVEHILVSADIRKKRRNIGKNVEAWLKKPNLGTIPLFMAGDKQYFYFANLLMKQNNLKLSIMGENMLETTMFKSGFCGIKPKFSGQHTYSLSSGDKIKMALFYGKQYLKNPAYINNSIFDTIDAFKSYYVIKHQNINIFDYIAWNENEIEKILIEQYNWETDPGTKTTWRIGDGTAAFYNYIYFAVAGFTENDTFRSNQIREGQITRNEALKLISSENNARWDSIKWYCNTIGLDFEAVIDKINNIKTLYRK